MKRIREKGYSKANRNWEGILYVDYDKPTITVFEKNPIVDTGLFDSFGEPIVRRVKKHKMGFNTKVKK